MNKKIKYDKSKEKTRNNQVLDNLKQGDQVFQAIIDSCDPNYQSYINKLVQNNTKTPSRQNKSLANVDQLFIKSPNKSKQQDHQHQQLNKNDTIPTHKVKNKSHGKGHSAKQEMLNPKISTRLNQNGRINISSQYTRFPTQQAQILKRVKDEQPSLICSEEQENLSQAQNIKFISGIDQYLMNLESSNTFTQKRTRAKVNRKKLFEQEDDIRNTQQILYENVKLRKKLKKYQKIIQELHQSAQNHLRYCRKKQKTNKSKMNQLIRSLAKAITKISEQKQQLDTMKTLFKNFGRKAQQYSKQYEEQSSDPQEIITESLIKGMKLSRPHSEQKLKNKKGIDYNIRRYLQEKDL